MKILILTAALVDMVATTADPDQLQHALNLIAILTATDTTGAPIEDH